MKTEAAAPTRTSQRLILIALPSPASSGSASRSKRPPK